MTALHVGTSGFSYDEWRPDFYPADLKKDAMLPFYAARLPAVELNNTFYRMPSKKQCAGWAAAVPDGFRFAVKASRRITWSQKLRDCGELLGYLFAATAALEDRLGCVFYQVPRYVRKDVPLLGDFLLQQPSGVKLAFEFAHESWLEDDVLELLRGRDAAVVLSDKDGGAVPELLDLGTWAYLRLRRSAYDDRALEEWRERLVGRGLEEAFVFFKHEESCAGPALARRFLDLAAAADGG